MSRFDSVDELNVNVLYRRAEALLRSGELEQAARSVRRCIALIPHASSPRTLAAIIALNQGDIQRASRNFQQGQDRATTPREAATNRVGQGRCFAIENMWENALQCFVRAGEECPDYLPALEGEAEARLNLGCFGDAENKARAAISVQASPKSRLVLARAILFQGRIEEAEHLFRPLLTGSGVEFEARFHLAAIARAKGEVGHAADEFRQLLRERPNTPAYYELAKSKRFKTRDDPDLIRIRQALDAVLRAPGRVLTGAALFLRLDLAFALGKAEEDAGLHSRARFHYELANKLHQQIEPADLASVKKRVARSKALDYDALTNGANQRSASGLAEPVLIVSQPRSGSSLLEQMLGVHPDVLAVGERGDLLQATRDAFDAIERSGALSVDVASRMRAALDGHARQLRILDKALDSYLYVGLVGAVLPKAKFIFLERHPMDAAWSQYSQYFAPGLGWTYNLDTIARYATLYKSCCDAWRRRFSERILSVHYEALVVRPESELRRIFEFLDLPYHAGCLQFQSVVRPVWTASNAQVREPLNRRGIARWLPHKHHLARLCELLEDDIRRYEAQLEAMHVPYRS